MDSLKIDDVFPTTAVVKFPTLKKSVTVRALDLNEYKLVNAAMGGDPTKEAEAQIEVCALGITDDEGGQPFNSEAGRQAIARFPKGMQAKIANAITGLSGLDGIALGNS